MKKLIHRIKDHWQTTLLAVMLGVGIIWFHEGKLEFSDFKTYIEFIPSVILLLMRDWNKKDEV